MTTSDFSKRVEQFLQRPELQRVFDEALRLAKTPGSRERIAAARKRVEARRRPHDGSASA